MDVIGILGGMGSYATLDFFRRILDAFPAEKEWDRPRVIIDNNCTMPSRVRAILYGEKKEQLIKEMAESVDNLVRSGATKVLLGCMTAHHFIDKLPHKDKIINIVKETAKTAESQVRPDEELLVLCTEGSIEVGVWSKVLDDRKIVYPNAEQMLKLREFIETVKQNKVTQKIQKEFAEYICEFSCENVLLGCTELPILLGEQEMKKRVIDPLQCAIEYLKKND